MFWLSSVISSYSVHTIYSLQVKKKIISYVCLCSKIHILQFIVIMFFYIGITYNVRYSNLVA